MAYDAFSEGLVPVDRDAPRRLRPPRRAADVLAHDLNNLLNVILAANEALAAQLPEGSDARELAHISQDAAEKSAELLRRMTSPSPSRSAPAVDCAAVLVDVARLANVSMPARVTVVVRAMAAPTVCAVDRAGLEAALLNLCANAGHAMPAGGAVQLSARTATLGEAAALALGAPPGRYAVVSVTDSGVGMSPEVLAQAMDAYFTTRREHGGTGLGLSSVRAFALRAGGALKLTSHVGRGTTATLYLPVA